MPDRLHDALPEPTALLEDTVQMTLAQATNASTAVATACLEIPCKRRLSVGFPPASRVDCAVISAEGSDTDVRKT